MQSLKEIKAKQQQQWQRCRFHQQWVAGELEFPLQIKLKRPTDKTLLHEYSSVIKWQKQLEKDCLQQPGIDVVKQQISFATMGRQLIPVAISIADIEALARFCGAWTQWQQFEQDIRLLNQLLPQLTTWQLNNLSQIVRHGGQWPKIAAVCQFFLDNPKPACYLRELKIPGVDSKFIERHKHLVKTLLDRLLPEEAINPAFTKTSEQGFEQRFGLKYDEPQIRFRVLDPMLYADFNGISDLSIPVSQFARLDCLIDRVYLTENKINGLAFPSQKNSIVIFGKGYGIQTLKQIPWLTSCKMYYWGDIDTDGFAMLSQIRGYFPATQSLLMDETTLLACKAFWGQEAECKKSTPEQLDHLSAAEQQLYQRLKDHYWQPRLRLEQERIPFAFLEEYLANSGSYNDSIGRE